MTKQYSARLIIGAQKYRAKSVRTVTIHQAPYINIQPACVFAWPSIPTRNIQHPMFCPKDFPLLFHPVSRIPYLVSRILYLVSRIPYPVSRISYLVSRIPYP